MCGGRGAEYISRTAIFTNIMMMEKGTLKKCAVELVGGPSCLQESTRDRKETEGCQRPKEGRMRSYFLTGTELQFCKMKRVQRWVKVMAVQ